MTYTAHTNHLPWPEQIKRVRGLSETHDIEDIAVILHITIPDVRRALEDSPRSKWWVRCRKTGRTATAYGKRGAYRIACLMGLTDWECGIGNVGENVQP
jgi:hypothetical protein